MEDKAPYHTQPVGAAQTPDVDSAIQRLLDMLGPTRLVDLVEKLSDVVKDTRYGDVTIVVVDGRARLVKIAKSWDWS